MRFNYFGVFFAIETMLLFVGFVEVSWTSMAFYAVTLLGAVSMWSEGKRGVI